MRALHDDHRRAGGNDEHLADRIAALVTGTVHYNGWRIDLHSYRVVDGWRPFVIIKGATFGMTADAPSVLWSVVPTHAQADTLALEAAKDWIDKKYG